MDPRINPFAPGAGTPPPELAGRDRILETSAIALDRIRAGRAARSTILYGLRGVGKTVLLNKIRLDAEARGIVATVLEAPENRSLPALLGPALRATLLRLSVVDAVRDRAARALRALAGFARTARLKYADFELAFDGDGEPGLADSGDLETDLTDLIAAVAEATRERGTAAALFIDELQYVPEDQLAALIMALHRANQNQLPVALVAAGLPQLLGQTGRAKSYAERLFEFVEVGPLDAAGATDALRKPVRQESADFDDAAITEIFRQTRGYPYFLQEWGKHAWNLAPASPIALAHAEAATVAALAELDASFFRVRFDRLTPSEKRYVHAMASLGDGPHRSGDIAERMERPVRSVAPTRATLIQKGMVYSPAHGDTAFTVPLFADFVLRNVSPGR
jgi:hypothetical protein